MNGGFYHTCNLIFINTCAVFNQGAISQMVYGWTKTENSEKIFPPNFDYNDPLSSQFCTCHNSSAVVTCAKLWADLNIIFYVTGIHRQMKFGL